MKNRKRHWTRIMFVEKAGLWLHYMDQGWKQAPATVANILKILKRQGITRGRVLELGCGNGRIILNLAKKGFDACGVDMSRLYIHDAVKKAREMNVKTDLRQGDYRRIDKIFKGKFDIVISIWTSIGFYGKKADELLFRKVSGFLRKNGLFLILNTMSRERLMSIFNATIFDADDEYVKLDYHSYDKRKSVTKNRWVFYKRRKRDLKYVDEIAFDLRIYSMREIIVMARNSGMTLLKAYDLLSTMKPANKNSPINMVFKKK